MELEFMFKLYTLHYSKLFMELTTTAVLIMTQDILIPIMK